MTRLFKELLDGSRGGQQRLDSASSTWLLKEFLQEPPASPRLIETMWEARHLVEKSCTTVNLDEFFLNTDRAQSLHGVSHSIRVAFWAAVLMQLQFCDGCEVTDAEVAVLAGLVHDSQRSNDGDDPEHAGRGAARLRDLQIGLAPDDFELLVKVVRDHDKPLTEPTGSRYRRVLSVVKAADGVDRWRLPLAKWWPKHELIVDIDARPIIGLAKILVLSTELGAQAYSRANVVRQIDEFIHAMSQ